MNFIHDPNTFIKHSLFSQHGKNLLKKYINQYMNIQNGGLWDPGAKKIREYIYKIYDEMKISPYDKKAYIDAVNNLIEKSNTDNKGLKHTKLFGANLNDVEKILKELQPKHIVNELAEKLFDGGKFRPMYNPNGKGEYDGIENQNFKIKLEEQVKEHANGNKQMLENMNKVIDDVIEDYVSKSYRLMIADRLAKEDEQLAAKEKENTHTIEEGNETDIDDNYNDNDNNYNDNDDDDNYNDNDTNDTSDTSYDIVNPGLGNRLTS
jgi:hypothetical protein